MDESGPSENALNENMRCASFAHRIDFGAQNADGDKKPRTSYKNDVLSRMGLGAPARAVAFSIRATTTQSWWGVSRDVPQPIAWRTMPRRRGVRWRGESQPFKQRNMELRPGVRVLAMCIVRPASCMPRSHAASHLVTAVPPTASGVPASQRKAGRAVLRVR